MNVREKRWIRFRMYMVAAFFLVGLAAVVVRAYQLQVLKSDQLEQMAREDYMGVTKLPSKRGTIFDREGYELALSVETGSVFAHPNRIGEKAKAAQQVANILGERQDNILKSLESTRPFVWIKRRIGPDRAKQVKALDLPGIDVITDTRRYYSCREIAAHLIGFVGVDNQGLEGLEKRYDEFLKGPQCSLIHMRDALGRPFSISRTAPSGKGMHDLFLTIDKDIQYKAQRALKTAVDRTGAKGGHCLVVDPVTGEILALAVVPEFNPNVFSNYEPYQWRNRIITDCYEPGSTLKAFLLAACLEEGVVMPDNKFNCEWGNYKVNGHVFHDTKEYGPLSVSDIIIRSSNIGAIKIGQKLGYERYYDYLMKFGFGSRTGVDLLGEREGFIRSPDNASPIDRASVYFGQCMSATSLQMAMAMAAIANGGKLMRPYVVKKVVDETGKAVEQAQPKVIRQVLSQETAEKVTEILAGVVSDKGTAAQAAIKGFMAAGKTGTSQKVEPETGAYSKTRYVATFVGFVPVDSPRLVILVVVDEPTGIVYGGQVAGPVFREVGLWSLNHLRVNPRTRLVLKGFDLQKDVASPAPRTEKANQCRLQVKPGLLPDFRGLGMREVIREGRSLGLKVLPQGSGLAFKQDPSPGTVLQEVDSVKVSFRAPS